MNTNLTPARKNKHLRNMNPIYVFTAQYPVNTATPAAYTAENAVNTATPAACRLKTR